MEGQISMALLGLHACTPQASAAVWGGKERLLVNVAGPGLVF